MTPGQRPSHSRESEKPAERDSYSDKRHYNSGAEIDLKTGTLMQGTPLLVTTVVCPAIAPQETIPLLPTRDNTP